MDRSIISNWVRQARYRAKNRNIYSDLQIEDVEKVIEFYDEKCVYCGAQADTLDHPFLLNDNTANTQSNVLPCCKSCKSKKKNNDLIWMFTNKNITEDIYLSLLKQIFVRKGGEKIKQHVKIITGFDGE